MSAGIVQMVEVSIKGRIELFTFDEANELSRQLVGMVSTTATESYRIKVLTAQAFGVPLRIMLSDCRRQPVAFARHVAMWMHQTLTDLSLEETGEKFPKDNGKPRDHGTVHYACRAVESRMETDKQIASKILALQKELAQAETAKGNL